MQSHQEVQAVIEAAKALQVESYNRTASKGSGKLARLFSAKKSPRDKTSPSPTSSMNLSPGSMGGPVSVADMLIYQNVSPCQKISAKDRCAALWHSSMKAWWLW